MITNDNFVDKAKAVMEKLGENKDRNGKPRDLVTTSKLRNILAMTADIYNDVRLLTEEDLPQNLRDKISYLRVRCLYEAGRTKEVAAFVKASNILEFIAVIKTKEKYILFNRYMEALVAWRKFLYEGDS
ncbi:MAG: type III-A CRISPR-associated protein Csm2 [Selenomonadaceae bacterium]|nr:type III-A CRISPR-associated protein Csm2 [Selenomonadaceae bacterium]